jgi:peptidyl-prolyl cis-trans isomerase A (cyclophilin A)
MTPQQRRRAVLIGSVIAIVTPFIVLQGHHGGDPNGPDVAAAGATGAAGAATTDVAITTADGTIVVRLEGAHAPITTKNFLHYVDTHGYDGATFYRTVRRATEPQASIEVIQGGLNPQTENPAIKPIPLEPTSKTGLHNVDGTIAMARTADPNSATTEFFIDVGDDRFLDAGGPTGPGYAAFGHVIRGMDVVRTIHTAAANGESLSPPVKILGIRRVR